MKMGRLPSGAWLSAGLPLLVLAACASFSSGDAPSSPDDASAPETSSDGAVASDAAASNEDAGSPLTDGDAGDPICNGAPSCKRVVFVTSDAYTGNLGGRSGADQKCQQRADASPLPRIKGRSFRAWLSITNQPVGDVLGYGSGPYVRPDGTPIATGFSGLVGSGLSAAIALDEYGNPTPLGTFAWTGTLGSGAAATDKCSDWKSGTGPNPKGLVGNVNDAFQWTNGGNSPACNEQRRLYCFEY